MQVSKRNKAMPRKTKSRNSKKLVINPIVKQINACRKWRDQIVAGCAEAGDPITTQAIHAWKNLRRGVPPDRVVIVSRVTGIPAHEIRPDVFPPPA